MRLNKKVLWSLVFVFVVVLGTGVYLTSGREERPPSLALNSVSGEILQGRLGGKVNRDKLLEFDRDDVEDFDSKSNEKKRKGLKATSVKKTVLNLFHLEGDKERDLEEILSLVEPKRAGQRIAILFYDSEDGEFVSYPGTTNKKVKAIRESELSKTEIRPGQVFFLVSSEDTKFFGVLGDDDSELKAKDYKPLFDKAKREGAWILVAGNDRKLDELDSYEKNVKAVWIADKNGEFEKVRRPFEKNSRGQLEDVLEDSYLYWVKFD